MALLGTAPHRRQAYLGTFAIDLSAGPYVSCSRIPVNARGADGPVSYTVLGPGNVEASQYVAPRVTKPAAALLVASAAGAIAVRRVQIVPPPPKQQRLIAVATYRDGIALHDARTFRLIGYVPIGGPPGDVTFDRQGTILSPDTDGDALASVQRNPWALRMTRGVPFGNEVAMDDRAGVFVSDRDAGGFGAVTRVSPDGAVIRAKIGTVAEGLAIDGARGLVYVGDVNDGTVTVVDAADMRVLRTIASVERTFGVALDSGRQRLYVVSNTSPSMRARGGYAAMLDVRGTSARIVARSARMTFPLGVAVDPRRARVFVTDEAANAVYVLNAKTLSALRAPLRTCATPWRPRIARGRLYVPCAGADRVDVFDLRTLRRVRGAPFATGGYPLGVALWPA